MMSVKIRVGIVAIAVLFGANCGAADGKRAACDNPAHRSFDFWVGSWTVTSGGKTAGHNTIRKRHRGCVLEENYATPGRGYTGSSLNSYDASTQSWQQTWMDSSGLVLNLHGGMVGKSMQMQGSRVQAKTGKRIQDRITWTPQGDGAVQQHWQVRSADDKPWKTVFLGIYRRDGK